MKLGIKISLLIGVLVLVIAVSIGAVAAAVTVNAQNESARTSLLNITLMGSAMLANEFHSQLNIFQELANRTRTRTMQWEILSESLGPDIY